MAGAVDAHFTFDSGLQDSSANGYNGMMIVTGDKRGWIDHIYSRVGRREDTQLRRGRMESVGDVSRRSSQQSSDCLHRWRQRQQRGSRGSRGIMTHLSRYQRAIQTRQ